MPAEPPEPVADSLDARTVRALTALLAIDPAAAAEVRERTPARRRPLRQYGPTLALGEPAGQHPADPRDGAPR